MARLNKRNRELKRLEQQLTSVQVTEMRHVAHQGPLPAPETLSQYNELMPGLANRIVTMAESEATHRRDLEKQILTARIDDLKTYRLIERTGQVCALLVALAAIIGGVVTIISGFPITGTILSGGTIITLVGLFIYGRERQPRESEGDTNQAPGEKKDKPKADELAKAVS